MGNYVFLPFENDEEACTATHTLTLLGAPEGYTISVGEAVVPPVQLAITCPFDNDDAIAYLVERTAPIMTAEQNTAFENWLTGEGEAEGCDGETGTPSADLEGAKDAMVAALYGPFAELYANESAGDTACELVNTATNAFFFQSTYEDEVGRQAVFELTTPPPPVEIEPTFTG